MSIRIKNLGLTLGGMPVLRDIDLELVGGQLIGLLGPNGAGKTTLLRCLAGLQTPERGEIKVDGQPLLQLNRAERARRLAYLPQNADCHWPMTVEDVVALGRLPWRLAVTGDWGKPNQDCQQAIDRAITESDLGDLRNRRVDSLSGGERRRVMLARTMATRADVLLADEPAAGLDPAHQLQLMELLAAKAAAGMTVIVVLHDLALAARYCRRLVLLEGGRVLGDGSPEKVMTPDYLAAAYGIHAHVGRVNDLPVIQPLSVRQ